MEPIRNTVSGVTDSLRYGKAQPECCSTNTMLLSLTTTNANPRDVLLLALLLEDDSHLRTQVRSVLIGQLRFGIRPPWLDVLGHRLGELTQQNEG